MKDAIRTDLAPPPGGYYSQGVVAGPFIFVSGQLPLDLEGRVQGDTIGEQTRKALDNVAAVLRANDASLDHLVSVTVYVSDIGLWPEVNEVYAECLASVEIPPARAVVPTRELHYGAMIEVSAIAYFLR